MPDFTSELIPGHLDGENSTFLMPKINEEKAQATDKGNREHIHNEVPKECQRKSHGSDRKINQTGSLFSRW